MKKTSILRKAATLSAAVILTAATLAGCGGNKSTTQTTAAVEAGTQEDTDEGIFNPGTYEGSAQGFGGEIIAKVTLSKTAIESVELVGDSETATIGGPALEKIQEDVVKRQTTNIDGVSGATATSDASFEAINAALTVAGVDPASLTGIAVGKVEQTEEIIETDIVIIGAGGAGMTAAITAKQTGADVIILEKMPMVGGNTTKATGGMNAAETKYQEASGIEDSVQTFIDDTMTGGYEINNPDLVAVMAGQSADAIDWLDTINAPLPKVSFSGGATNARIHAPEDGSAVGNYLINAFSEQLKELNVPIYLETKATEIIVKNGAAVGVRAESETTSYVINAKAVILATGGFGANEELYTKYREDLKGFVTTNTPGATGDGLVMAEDIGAALVDIEQIQIHPTVEQATSIMITEAVRGDGAILVNSGGKRFTNEMLTRDVVSAAEIAQDGGYAYIIFDQNIRDNLKAIESYVKAGIAIESATIEELAGKLNMDPTTLTETLTTWNEAVATKNDTEFGRATGMEHDLSTAPYYAVKIAPGVHHTMGGVKINTSCEVISAAGEVISGLYAAGEVTGGVHGGNRIGGNAVADIVVFGRIAGDSAAGFIQ